MTTRRGARWRVALAALGLALLAGCATPQRPDPLEPVNRGVFAFNETVDRYVIAPPARVYRDVVPSTIRLGVSNFFNNLRDAWSAVNLLLQGRPADATQDVMRFSINTVFGLGGVLDWASEMGLDPHYEDFGQTLGRWGAGPGAYLVLPILGPSTVRDTAALPLDLNATTPEQLVESVRLRNGLIVLRVVNTRADLLGATGVLDDVALDKYSFVRDAYLQRRRSLVHDGELPEDEAGDGDVPPPLTPAPAAPATAPASSPGAPAR